MSRFCTQCVCVCVCTCVCVCVSVCVCVCVCMCAQSIKSDEHHSFAVDIVQYSLQCVAKFPVSALLTAPNEL